MDELTARPSLAGRSMKPPTSALMGPSLRLRAQRLVRGWRSSALRLGGETAFTAHGASLELGWRCLPAS